MQMNHAAFARSPALRLSLKRGLARQAIATAERNAADFCGLFELAIRMRPNAKGVERLATRLRGRRGVTRSSLSRDEKHLTFIARDVRLVEARVQGETAFRETGLIYIRAKVGMSGGRLVFSLSAVSYSCHALERLVERSSVDLHSPLLPRIDTEAHAIFRAWDAGRKIEEAEDEYFASALPGLWAGGHDRMEIETDWGLETKGAPTMPIFSARTYLSEKEMRPTVWLRWKDDPTCRMV